MAVKWNKHSKKRKYDDSSEDDEYYEDLKYEVRAKKFKAQDPEKPTKPKIFQKQLLVRAMQKDQIDIFERSERRFEEF